MSQVLVFQPRRPLLWRKSPALRLVAALIALFFALAVVWTSVVTMGGYCLTSDSYAPLPRASH